MDVFIKACGGILLSVILILTIGSKNKDLSMVLGITICCMTSIAALEYIRPVISFLNHLEEVGELDHSVIRILLKVTGIGLISEIASMVCSDSGCSSLGKVVKFMGSAVILWLCLPLYAMLLELLMQVFGDL